MFFFEKKNQQKKKKKKNDEKSVCAMHRVFFFMGFANYHSVNFIPRRKNFFHDDKN